VINGYWPNLSKEKMRVNKTVPIHAFPLQPFKLSVKSRSAMRLGEYKPRERIEGEAPPVTFNHLLDGQVYKSDWSTPARPGALDHLNISSKGEHD